MDVLKIGGKSSDCNFYSVTQDGEELVDKDGYIPEGLGVGGGDYFDLQIDLATGQILNWKPMTAQQAVKLITGDEDED